jgi:hypothetical protein
MTAHELLSQLREKGVEVKTSGDDRLVIDAPKGTVTEELRSALSANKAELLQILKAEQAATESPAPSEAAVTSEMPPELVPSIPEFVAPVSEVAANEPAPLSPLHEAMESLPELVPSVPELMPIAPEVLAAAQEPGANAAEPLMASSRQDEDAMISASATEEITQLEIELVRLRTEEEGRRAEVEAGRLTTENALRAEQERWRRIEEQTARERAQKERERIEVEARQRAEEEHHRRMAEQELARVEEELTRMRAMEESRRAQVEAQRAADQTAHEAELATLRSAEEGHAQNRAEQERHYLETEGRKKAQEDELRRRAEMRFRAVEEEIERVRAREDARIRAAEESQRLAEEAARRRAEEDARRHAEAEALRRAEEEARLRAEIEAQLRAEAEQRRMAEEATRRQAEEEARRRAEEEALRLAAEHARRLAEEEAHRRADEEARRQAEEAAHLLAEEEARRQAEAQAKLNAEEEVRLRAEAERQQRAELEARIRAEIEAKIRAEEAERREAERHEAEAAQRRAEHERILAEEGARAQTPPELVFEIERAEVEEPPVVSAPAPHVTEIAEWFDVAEEPAKPIQAIEPAYSSMSDDHFGADAGDEFAPVSVPETNFAADAPPAGILSQLSSERPAERAAAVGNLPRMGGEEAFRHVSAAFDDQSIEVRSAAARAMFDLQEDRAAAFTRALREATPERRRKIGAAIASSGLANEAIRNLTGESRDKTFDAFSLLFLMSKAGETQPLMRAIEEHSNIDVRLAVVKLLALSGQPDILPAFRRMAVRGSLPPEVRSAVMEAIYQITSQSPAEAPSML